MLLASVALRPVSLTPPASRSREILPTYARAYGGKSFAQSSRLGIGLPSGQVCAEDMAGAGAVAGDAVGGGAVSHARNSDSMRSSVIVAQGCFTVILPLSDC